MRTRVFTTGVLLRRGRLLILKRKASDDTYPGMWDCVGGHFEEGESAEECMTREAKEECGLDVEIERVGRLIEYLDRYGRAVAVPFVLRPVGGRLRLTEHDEYRWIEPGEAVRYDIVPDLEQALAIFGLAPD